LKRSRRLSTSCSQQRAAILEASLLDLEPLLRRLSRRETRKAGKGSYFSTTGLASRATASESVSSDKKSKDASPPLSWQERLWGASAKKGGKPLKPDDLPGRGDDCDHGAMFNYPRSVSAKMSLDPRLRCTEVDENGKVILVDGEFKKTELIAKVCGSPIC
jgi:magnesium transporter